MPQNRQNPNRKDESIRRANRVIQTRTFVLMLIMGIGMFIVLFFKLYSLQITRHEELQSKAVSQQTRSSVVNADRGTIYDASGNILAISSTAETIFLSPKEINDALNDEKNPVTWTKETLAGALADILDVSEEGILKKMARTNSMYEVLKYRVEEDVANEVRQYINDHKVKGVFLTTDAAISAQMLQKALSTDVQSSFNMVSVDGDTSTNDMVVLLANGMAGNEAVTAEGEDFAAFMTALNTVTVALCRAIAGDGEGATRLLECKVTGAKDEKTARTVAKSVICSSLLKAAMFGADANWGRVLCAIGYSGAAVDVGKNAVSFQSAQGEIPVCEKGAGVPFSEEEAKKILLEKEIDILVNLNDGTAAASAWGCDLSYDYVKINGDYRT